MNTQPNPPFTAEDKERLDAVWAVCFGKCTISDTTVWHYDDATGETSRMKITPPSPPNCPSVAKT